MLTAYPVRFNYIWDIVTISYHTQSLMVDIQCINDNENKTNLKKERDHFRTYELCCQYLLKSKNLTLHMQQQTLCNMSWLFKIYIWCFYDKISKVSK